MQLYLLVAVFGAMHPAKPLCGVQACEFLPEGWPAVTVAEDD